ncbi:MAG: hypothetical protein LBU11_01615 [Zoogloeaceae bacterium]|nr:hypothetical protein [Zoogloeaceae bacterium]
MKLFRQSTLSALSLVFAALLAACSSEQTDDAPAQFLADDPADASPAAFTADPAGNAETSAKPANDPPEGFIPPIKLSGFFQNGETPAASLVPGTKPDIVGIRLGDHFNMAKLKQLNPAFSYSWYQDEEGNRSGVRASSPREVMIVFWNGVGMIRYVSREVQYEEDKRPLVDVLHKAFLEKYGQTPSGSAWYSSSCSASNDVCNKFWDYDNAGNLYRGGQICNHSNSSAKEGCGYWVQAAIKRTTNMGDGVVVVDGSLVAAGYDRPFYEGLVYDAEAKERARQQKAEEERQKALRNQDAPAL